MIAVAVRGQTMSQRHSKDFYPTPAIATEALLKREMFAPLVWECACGDGSLSKVLEKNDYKTFNTDLYDYGYGESKRDFLSYNSLPFPVCDIVTNPPFKLANQFVLKALELKPRKFAFLLRLAFLEGIWRKENIFVRYPPSSIYVFSKRLTIWRGDQDMKGNGTTAYAWFVWNSYSVNRSCKVHWI